MLFFYLNEKQAVYFWFQMFCSLLTIKRRRTFFMKIYIIHCKVEEESY
jgi:hypothetical protein